MIPARFDYEVAESVEHALELLGAGDAKLLAGGHSLIPALKLRIARPERLVDIGRLTDLAYVRDAGTQIAIGALTRHQAVGSAPLLQEHCPIVSRTAAQIGDPQVRHRGTIGGSLAHGDPASEFFTGVFETAVGPGEMLTEIRVPKLGDRGSAYNKARRRAQDWATVGVAAIVRRANGGFESASIALVSMGATPLRATSAENALLGGASVADAAALLADGTEPPSDHAGSSAYRAHLVTVIGRRALEEALA